MDIHIQVFQINAGYNFVLFMGYKMGLLAKVKFVTTM